MNTDFNAILDITREAYKAALRPQLVADIFSTPEQKAERKRLDRIGPSHGPWQHEVSWIRRHGRITTYYKGRVRGHGWYTRRTDCDC